MPTASLTFDIIIGAPTAGDYPVTFTVTGQTELGETEVLVIRRSDDQFDRVATLFDLGDFPVGSNPSFEFYRANTTTVNYTDVDKANSGIAGFKESMDFLVQAYAAFREKLVTESVTVSEDFI